MPTPRTALATLRLAPGAAARREAGPEECR
jgi:hypothetical protein